MRRLRLSLYFNDLDVWSPGTAAWALQTEAINYANNAYLNAFLLPGSLCVPVATNRVVHSLTLQEARGDVVKSVLPVAWDME
jgi:hypothetical protein